MKKFTKIIITPLILLILSNCTPARIIQDNHNHKTATGEVHISRDNSVVLLLVPAIFGYDGQDKVKLSKGESAKISIPVGKHEFFSRSNQADKPKKITVDVKKDQTICFITKPADLVVLKSIFIPWYWMSNAFDLRQVENCNK